MSSHLDPPLADVRALVQRALAEDLTPLGDLTASLLDPDLWADGEFVAREGGVVAGRLCVSETFAAVDARLTLDWELPDGSTVRPGQRIATARGPLATMLTAERTALNMLSHLSGVATQVRTFVDRADGGARIWDTRKTTPGLRSLQKAAVRAGGGVNHRGNLSDWVMIKDNHLAGMTIAELVGLARERWPARTVHVECDRRQQVIEALDAGADALLLDNMTPDEVSACVQLVAGRCLVEASGGIDLDTVAAYAGTGVDLLSVGRITNSAPVLDIGLDITPDDVVDREES
jgi:nicotinate-nucleotide pyrophosphorylase (carboxylating)